MFSLIVSMKFFASSIDLLGFLSRYLFTVPSERRANISLSSLILSCLNVSLSVFKTGNGVKFFALHFYEIKLFDIDSSYDIC